MSRSFVRRRQRMDGNGREQSGGRGRAGRRVRVAVEACDCCSAVLARTHDYVCYGTVCPGCWCRNAVADRGVEVSVASH